MKIYLILILLVSIMVSSVLCPNPKPGLLKRKNSRSDRIDKLRNHINMKINREGNKTIISIRPLEKFSDIKELSQSQVFIENIEELYDSQIREYSGKNPYELNETILRFYVNEEPIDIKA